MVREGELESVSTICGPGTLAHLYCLLYGDKHECDTQVPKLMAIKHTLPQ